MRINDTFKYLHLGLPEDILRKKMHGDFDGAIELINQHLADPRTSVPMRHCLTVQQEMLRRTPVDFIYSIEEALSMVRELIPDFSKEELTERMDDRRIRWAYVDGEIRIISKFLDTLIKADPSFALRANKSLPGFESALNAEEMEDPRDRCIRIMKEKGSLSCRIRIRASIKLHEEHFEKGMFLRAHLPIPCACQQQSDIQIEKIYPENGILSPVDAPQRTVCWEEYMEENHEFYVEYSYIHTAVYHDTDHMTVDTVQPSFYTEEVPPHIMFTPYIKALTDSVTEGAFNNLEKAKKIYDYITTNMKYTYMPAYFVLENIAENCAKSFTGDCGVFALLFITMCRCAGIPARWQSGLAAEPDFCGCHDWAEFYIAPYGWLLADNSYGVSATRLQKEERRQFYFGNLEPYRMVANSAFQQEFTIPKDHWRADPYDNQSGEMETSNRGFRFDEYEQEHIILLHEEL